MDTIEIRNIEVFWNRAQQQWQAELLANIGGPYICTGERASQAIDGLLAVVRTIEETEPRRSDNPFVKLDNALDRAILAVWSDA